MKKDIKIWEHASEIMQAVEGGVLLTTKAGETLNAMTISWGSIGIEWSKPIFTVYVRENRFTRQQLDRNREFTINIPHGEFDKKILGFCGSRSGSKVNKLKELGLTLENSDLVSVPGIKELPLTLECKVLYKQLQDKNEISEEFKQAFYPYDVDSSHYGANKDFHVAYYGEIVRAYIIE